MPDADHEAQHHRRLFDQLRTKLLDLSRKNPMLNYRHRVGSRRQLRIVDCDLETVLAELAGKQGELPVEALPEPDDIPDDERTAGFLAALGQARAMDLEYLTRVQALDAVARQDDAALADLDRWLRDHVRRRLGLPPRPDRQALDVVAHARKHGIEPAYELAPASGDGTAPACRPPDPVCRRRARFAPGEDCRRRPAGGTGDRVVDPLPGVRISALVRAQRQRDREFRAAPPAAGRAQETDGRPSRDLHRPRGGGISRNQSQPARMARARLAEPQAPRVRRRERRHRELFQGRRADHRRPRPLADRAQPDARPFRVRAPRHVCRPRPGKLADAPGRTDAGAEPASRLRDRRRRRLVFCRRLRSRRRQDRRHRPHPHQRCRRFAAQRHRRRR